ncbi:putative transporter [Lasiodiplodia theobromae]|uniref:Putative transporter n=1 Tax=Lasiodiplodia theobromae TaxID=45133 RepID=A0A5N5D5D2_9PEZI|nr:putative transporter [Lasiodiplodia theobromae]
MAEVTKPASQEDSTIGKSETVVDAVEHNPALDRKLLRKRDMVLIPITGVLYTLLFLDRTNIANARALGIGSPDGLEGALDMPANGYNVALCIFYIPFVLAEIPANLVLNWNRFPPRYLLGGQMLLLGILGMCQGLTQSYGGLLAVRFLMGVFEASLPAGATYLISVYYTKREAALRFAWFFNFALAGPLFSGLLAYAIQKNVDGAGGYQGWRWVFIIEGLMTILTSLPVLLLTPNLPHAAQSWFLRPHERDRLLAHLSASSPSSSSPPAAAPSAATPLRKILLDWRIHTPTLIFFCTDMTAASIASFAPTIVAELGLASSHTVAQLLTMPIWATGIVFTFVLTGLAARCDCRTPFLLLAIASQLGGWSILRAGATSSADAAVLRPGARYAALFLLAAGTVPQMALLLSWLSANLRGGRQVAVGTAWMTGFGNCANFVAANVFIKSEAPRYVTGATTGLGFTVAGFVLVVGFAAGLVRANKRREEERARLSDDDEKGRFDEVRFRYVL